MCMLNFLFSVYMWERRFFPLSLSRCVHILCELQLNFGHSHRHTHTPQMLLAHRDKNGKFREEKTSTASFRLRNVQKFICQTVNFPIDTMWFIGTLSRGKWCKEPIRIRMEFKWKIDAYDISIKFIRIRSCILLHWNPSFELFSAQLSSNAKPRQIVLPHIQNVNLHVKKNENSISTSFSIHLNDNGNAIYSKSSTSSEHRTRMIHRFGM